MRDSEKTLVCKSLKAKDSNSGIKTLFQEKRGNISFLWLGGGAGVGQADTVTGSQTERKLRKCYGLNKGLKTKNKINNNNKPNQNHSQDCLLLQCLCRALLHSAES